MRIKTNSSAATDTAVVQTEWLKQDDITLLDGFTDADVDKVLPEADEADTMLEVNMTAKVVVGVVTMVESYVDSAKVKIYILNLYQHIFLPSLLLQAVIVDVMVLSLVSIPIQTYQYMLMLKCMSRSYWFQLQLVESYWYPFLFGRLR